MNGNGPLALLILALLLGLAFCLLRAHGLIQ